MTLNQAITKIAELPMILKRYGVAPENVLNVEYNALATQQVDVQVHLHGKETIQKLGVCDAESEIGHDDTRWTQFRIIKDGISFVCWDREGEAIA
ncbi:hypothetical protein [Lysinibacillus sphaericus]|uniref:hypothetical protein n=1 Tax=Lysinibacillus sphaericus TaxID=1421 RepID=UPI00056B0ED2|nr:hypothetical protein [Lysinibacillus sphaericus]